MAGSDARHILHVDMDAFFAAVEQLDRPELRGKPVLVGGSPEGRGVVSAASYEARTAGCHSAMPMARAVRLCPEAVVVRPRIQRYVELSRQVFAIFEEFTPLLEPLSIDEAFLDVTGSIRLLGEPEQIASDLKRRIREQTGLTGSVGVAPNKFLAKLASDLRKPDGLVVVPPDAIQEFLDPLPVSRLWGAGRVTQQRFERLGIRTFADIRRMSHGDLADRFGEAGEHFYRLVRGLDDREVVPDRQAKSISHEVTFRQDIDDAEYLRGVLLHQTEHVALRLRRHDLAARTVVLKVRTEDFATVTRRTTLSVASDQTEEFFAAVRRLFDKWCGRRATVPKPVRLVGMGVAQLSPATGQQLLLFEQEKIDRRRRLDSTMDEIRRRFGEDAVSRGGAPRPKRD